MFDAASGSMHLVFANRDDDYLTPNLIKMNFLRYLQYQLHCSGFRYIFTISPAAKGSGYDYALQWVGRQSQTILNEEQNGNIKAQPSFGQRLMGLFGGGQSAAPAAPQQNDCAIGEIQMRADEVAKQLSVLLSLMNKKNGIAFALPAELFCAHKSEELVAQFMGIEQNNLGNILVLTLPPRAADCDRLFRTQSLNDRGENGALYDGRLLPKFVSRSEGQSLSYRVLRYDLLKEALGNQVHCWNTLDDTTVHDIVEYTFLRHPDWTDHRRIDLYAAILAAWHRNASFRDKYFSLRCKSNPLRENSILFSDLESEHSAELRSTLAKIAEKEGFASPEQVKELYPADDENDIRILRSETQPGFLDILEQYRAVLRTHEALLEPEQTERLLGMIESFRKPDYLHTQNAHKPIFCKLYDPDEYKFFSDILNGLKKKAEWCNWDEASMYIMYALFCRIDEDARQNIKSDDLHYDAGQAYQVSRRPLEHCRMKAVSAPFEEKEPAAFTQEVIAVLSLEKRDAIRKSSTRLIYN